jgi:hypothetical protein
VPEVFAEFFPFEAEDPHQADFFELSALANGDWDETFDDLGIPSVYDMMGTDQMMHEAIAASRPAALRVAWDTSMENWQDPQVGLDWAKSLLAAWEDWPEEVDNHAYVQEQLTDFTKVLTRAKAAGLTFRLLIDG